MNKVYIVTVDTTPSHGTRVKWCAEILLKCVGINDIYTLR